MKVKMAALVFSALMMIHASAAEQLTLVKVTEIGVMKNKVIFQSKSVKKVKGTNLVKGKLVAQWGLHVFEVVNGFYSCNKKNICKLTDYERVATFESCVVKNQKVKCSKKIAGEDGPSNDERDVILSPDGMDDGSHRDNQRESIDELENEFGSSINAEADII